VEYATVPIIFRGGSRNIKWYSNAPVRDAFPKTMNGNTSSPLDMPMLTVNISLIRIDDIEVDHLLEFMFEKNDLSAPGRSAEEWTLSTWVDFYYYDLELDRRSTHVIEDEVQVLDTGNFSYILPSEIHQGLYFFNISFDENLGLTSQYNRYILDQLNGNLDKGKEYFIQEYEGAPSSAWVSTAPFLLNDEIGTLDYSIGRKGSGSNNLIKNMEESLPAFAFRGGDMTINWVLIGGVRKPEISNSTSNIEIQMTFEGELGRGEIVSPVTVFDTHELNKNATQREDVTAVSQAYSITACAPRNDDKFIVCIKQYLRSELLAGNFSRHSVIAEASCAQFGISHEADDRKSNVCELWRSTHNGTKHVVDTWDATQLVVSVGKIHWRIPSRYDSDLFFS
jgi:hypothetical protein